MRTFHMLSFGWMLGVCTMGLIPAGGCDPAPAAKVVSCALADGKLQVAFTDPKRAKAYLEQLGQRLKAGEPAAIEEAGELSAAIAGCLK